METPAKGHPEYEGTNPVIGQGVLYMYVHTFPRPTFTWAQSLSELMEILLENDIQTYDSLLLAIEEEYVEGVELLLEHEERVWHSGTPHSWEVSTHC